MRSKLGWTLVAGLVASLGGLWLALGRPDAPEPDGATVIASAHPAREEALASPPRARPRAPGAADDAKARKIVKDQPPAPRERRARSEAGAEASSPGEIPDRVDAPAGSEDVTRTRQLIEALRGTRPTSGGDPFEPIDVEMAPEDVALLDLDGDGAVAPWELERNQRLVDRAEHHPVRYDLDDGAYPIAREDYRRDGWEFDAVDIDQDGLLDVDEYHSFLFEAESVSVGLDADGDRVLSYEEAGLSEADFTALDVDGSGALKAWEVRRGVATGAF